MTENKVDALVPLYTAICIMFYYTKSLVLLASVQEEAAALRRYGKPGLVTTNWYRTCTSGSPYKSGPRES